MDDSARWAIEPLFSDFKSRGSGLEDSQISYADRLSQPILVMALALYIAVSRGQWDADVNQAPPKKTSDQRPRKLERSRTSLHQRLALMHHPDGKKLA